MKIGILTQPLANNYGGTLQNYALQTVLRKLGHEPVTIDYVPRRRWWPWFCMNIKSLFLWPFVSKRRAFLAVPYSWKRNRYFEFFTSNHISTTKKIRCYTPSLISEYGLDAVIVGSDQVWRPKYNRNIEDSFLKFAEGYSIRRIAYAASFGVDYWEFSDQQTRVCQELSQKFDAISVREDSGILLCEEYLHIKATLSIDPTLLLKKEDYEKLIAHIPKNQVPFLAAYILDGSEEKNRMVAQFADEKGWIVQAFSMDKQATLSVYEWLAVFRDAQFIITDSFHGVVFSIIFEKEYLCLYNGTRGNTRIESIERLRKQGMISDLKTQSISFLIRSLS